MVIIKIPFTATRIWITYIVNLKLNIPSIILFGDDEGLLTPKIWSMLYIVLGLISSVITLDCDILNTKKKSQGKCSKTTTNKLVCHFIKADNLTQ